VFNPQLGGLARSSRARRQGVSLSCGGGKAGRKVFFFEKKKQKNFCSLDDQAVSGVGCVSPGAKVFLVLFSKKNTLRLYP
jgi:hypothetical protein